MHILFIEQKSVLQPYRLLVFVLFSFSCHKMDQFYTLWLAAVSFRSFFEKTSIFWSFQRYPQHSPIDSNIAHNSIWCFGYPDLPNFYLSNTSWTAALHDVMQVACNKARPQEEIDPLIHSTARRINDVCLCSPIIIFIFLLFDPSLF